MQETDFYEYLLSLPDLAVDRVESSAKRITLHCHTTTLQQPCPHCLRPTSHLNQYTRRQMRDLDRNIALDVLPNRLKSTLTSHFEGLGPKFCAQIESVSLPHRQPALLPPGRPRRRPFSRGQGPQQIP